MTGMDEKNEKQVMLEEFDQIEREMEDENYQFQNKFLHEIKSVRILIWLLLLISIIQLILIVLIFLKF